MAAQDLNKRRAKLAISSTPLKPVVGCCTPIKTRTRPQSDPSSLSAPPMLFVMENQKGYYNPSRSSVTA